MMAPDLGHLCFIRLGLMTDPNPETDFDKCHHRKDKHQHDHQQGDAIQSG